MQWSHPIDDRKVLAATGAAFTHLAKLEVFRWILCEDSNRRKIRLIEGNAKCRHLKNWPVQGLCGRRLSVRCPEPPPPLHYFLNTVLYLFTQGAEGRVEPERRLEWQQFKKLGRKYQHDWLYLQMDYDKRLPPSPFTGNFVYDDILLRVNIFY